MRRPPERDKPKLCFVPSSSSLRQPSLILRALLRTTLINLQYYDPAGATDLGRPDPSTLLTRRQLGLIRNTPCEASAHWPTVDHESASLELRSSHVRPSLRASHRHAIDCRLSLSHCYDRPAVVFVRNNKPSTDHNNFEFPPKPESHFIIFVANVSLEEEIKTTYQTATKLVGATSHLSSLLSTQQRIMSSLEAKIVVLGAQGVGKTSLVMRYCKGAFNPSQITSTVGASFLTKRVVDSDSDTIVRLQIWDTGSFTSTFTYRRDIWG